MTPAEVARVLAKCAAYDNRTVGEVDIHTWHESIGDLEYADALVAVAEHYRGETDWIMPAHIRPLARDAKRARLRREGVKSEVLALPSRYETDLERDARKATGVAACRDAIAKARPDQDTGPSAMDTLRNLTDGPRWPDPDVAA